MEPKRLTELFRSHFGTAPTSCNALPASGSNRHYYRITDNAGHSAIGAEGTSVPENNAFVKIAIAFREQGLNVPTVLTQDESKMYYLQDDLGDKSLYDRLATSRKSGGKYTEEETLLLERVMQDLPRLQCALPQGHSAYNSCHPVKRMDHQAVMFDLNYFKYCYAKLTETEFDEVSLEADFESLAKVLLSVSAWGFQYRDFQARNILLAGTDGTTPYYIDFQGGRFGPMHYDLASFLWQASANYSPTLREHLISTYLNSLTALRPEIDCAKFRSELRQYVLFRTLQVLGAYGYRGLWQRKQHFIDSIPPALNNLRALIGEGALNAYPTLLQLCTDLTREKQNMQAEPKKQGLTVDIYSFSFKRGIPDDPSGNGGGYVFDCRSSNNPGRYDEYKPLTGRDLPVINFLENDGEILQFLDHIYPLANFHVRRYIDRGFTHLQFAFGCTGGRHRSVYSAQHLAEYLHERFPEITIHLVHREQGISQTF